MKRFTTLLIVCLGASTQAAWADEDSFNQAVSTYLRGFQDCVDANTLRTKDVAGAKAKYASYLKLKDEAAKTDPSILKTDKRDMAKNIEYCTKTQDNIAKAEASPIIEQGMAHCDGAQKALENKDTKGARSEFDIYADAKNKAFAITDKVVETFSIGSKVKACARIEEKLIAAENEQKAFENSTKEAVDTLENYSQKCADVRAQAEKPEASVDDLSSIKENYLRTQEIKKGFSSIKTALQIAEKQPAEPLSQQIKASQAKGVECEKAVVAVISKLEAEKKKLDGGVEQTTSLFQRSLESCRSARTLVDQSGTNESQYTRARNVFNDSQKLKGEAESNSATFETTKKYPQWDSTQKMKSIITLLYTCEQGVESAISRKDQEIAKAKQDQAEKDKQKVLAAEIAAKRKADDEAAQKAKQDQAEKDKQKALAAEIAAKRKADDEAAQKTKQDNEAAAAAEAAAEKTDKKRSVNTGKANRNSWTDLVPEDQAAQGAADEPKKEAARAASAGGKNWTDIVPK